MTQLLQFEVAGGLPVLVEVDDGASRVTRGGRPGEMITQASESLEHALGRLGPVLHGVVTELRTAAEWPDEVAVEFAVKLSADANVIIARSGGEANFRILVRWSQDRHDG